MKILIVDDSRAMRLLIGRALRGMELPNAMHLEAADGNEALKVIEEEHPEIVISDFNMPGMGGMDLLRALKAKGSEVRFGFVTSEASGHLRQEAQQAGADFLLNKPFTPATLNQALGPVLADLGCSVEKDDGAPAAYLGTQTPFPKADQVAGILQGLLGRAVTAAAAPAVALPLRNGHIVVEYLRVDDGAVIGCGIYDIACAARMGSALTLIPAGAAAEAVRMGRVDENMAENFREVLNVMSRLFDSGGSSRVCLGPVHRPGEALPPELAARMSKPSARLDNSVDIAGYGKGNLTLLSLRP